MVKTLFTIIATAFCACLLGETALVVCSISDGTWVQNVPNCVEVGIGWLVVLVCFYTNVISIARHRV